MIIIWFWKRRHRDFRDGCHIRASFGCKPTVNLAVPQKSIPSIQSQNYVSQTDHPSCILSQYLTLPYKGQLRLQAYSHIASGANSVMYWHWHSLHNARETYWKGLLSHDFQENDIYLEACVIGKELQKIGSHLVIIILLQGSHHIAPKSNLHSCQIILRWMVNIYAYNRQASGGMIVVHIWLYPKRVSPPFKVAHRSCVIGYQVDNETKHYGTAGRNVQEKFVKYLREK